MLPKQERIKVSPNFYLDEFLNPQTYGNVIGDKYAYWQNLFNTKPDKFWFTIFKGQELKKLVNIAQSIRDRYGKTCIINNWGIGGDRVNSGFRTTECTIGAPHSAHKEMKGEDILIAGMKAKDVYIDVIKNQSEFMSIGVTEIEDGTWNKDTGDGWTHLGTRTTGLKTIKVIPFYK